MPAEQTITGINKYLRKGDLVKSGHWFVIWLILPCSRQTNDINKELTSQKDPNW